MTELKLVPTAATHQQFQWDKILEAWLNLHAPNTRRGYLGIKEEFEEGAACPLVQATESHVIKFLDMAAQRPGMQSRLDPSDTKAAQITVAVKARALRSMAEELKRAGFIEHNPWDVALSLLKRARAGDKRPTGAIPLPEVQRLLEAPSASSKEGLRDRAYLNLLFGGGLRLSEALGIRISDVEEHGAVFVRLIKTKAGHHAIQELSEAAGKWVVRYRSLRIEEHAGPTDFLLVVYADGIPRAHRVSIQTAEGWFKRLCKSVGLVGHYTPHFARATAITRLLDLGVPHREVQQFSRHRSIVMVELYDKRRYLGVDSPVKKLHY